jgi:hypothetical protein
MGSLCRSGAARDVCKNRGVLTLATLGMFAYGTYSAAWAVVDVVRGARIELWAEALIVLFGVLLILAAAFVRVRMPGGLAVAISAMLALQALEVHTAAHLESGLIPQVGRAVLAFFLVGSAVAGEGARQR